MLIPLVAQLFAAGEPVRFYWCWSCMELSAFVGEPGNLAVRFASDNCGGWHVFQAVGAERRVHAAISAVAHVQADWPAWHA
jgi:hypothetical protein